MNSCDSGAIRLDVFSGTGNTMRVANWVEAAAADAGRGVDIVRITHAEPDRQAPEGLLGILTPTHGFTAPWAVIKHVARLPGGRGCPAFCLATRAGLRFGAVELPGISGTCTYLITLLLWLKGYRVRGVLSVNMPSNWFSLHPMQAVATHATIIASSRGVVESFAARMLAGSRSWLSVSNVYELLFGLALVPFSLGYFIYGRFFFAKLFFANGDCDGCGTCAFVCPVEAIKLTGPQESRRPYWTHHCENCMRCAAFCPHNSVEAGHSWAALVGFIGAVPVSAWVTAWMVERMPAVVATGPLIDSLFNLLYFYLSLFVSYWLFSRALRFRPINWLFTHTTLTHYWRRYREVDTRMKALTGPKRNRWARPMVKATCDAEFEQNSVGKAESPS